MQSVQGWTALVTGASSGIGRAFAVLLAQHGADLILTARSKEGLEDLATELNRDHGIAVHVLAQDLAAAGGARRLLEQVTDARWDDATHQRRAEPLAGLLEVDLLVNNAGVGRFGWYHRQPWETTEGMLTLNMGAPAQLAHRLLAGMAARGRGGVINVASVLGFMPVPRVAAYAASKAFLLSLSEALWDEYRGSGVTVTALCPGTTATTFGSGTVLDVRRMERGADPMIVARAGLRGFLRGRRVVVPGPGNKAYAWLGQRLPRGAVIAGARFISDRYLVGEE